MLVRVAHSLRGSRTVAYSRAATAAWGSNRAGVNIPPQPPSLLRNTNAFQTRSLASAAPGGVNPRIQRAYPQYAVHGESHMMSVKMIVPGYRLIKGESLVVDNARKGRMLLEFTARGSDGNYMWNDQTRFALSVEEVGLLCNQLPEFSVELSRSPNTSAPGEEAADPFAAMSNDMPDKVLKVAPAEGASVSFLIDFVRDGIGGQSPGLGQDGSKPMEVVAQAGEFEVISAIMKASLPILAGWSPLIDIAVQSNINEAVDGGYGGGRGGSGAPSGGGGGGRFRGSGMAGSGVPF